MATLGMDWTAFGWLDLPTIELSSCHLTHRRWFVCTRLWLSLHLGLEEMHLGLDIDVHIGACPVYSTSSFEGVVLRGRTIDERFHSSSHDWNAFSASFWTNEKERGRDNLSGNQLVGQPSVTNLSVFTMPSIHLSNVVLSSVRYRCKFAQIITPGGSENNWAC